MVDKQHMKLIPHTLIQQLGFDQFQAELIDLCRSEKSKSMAQAAQASADRAWITRSLEELDFLLRQVEEDNRLQLQAFEFADEIVRSLPIENYVLSRPIFSDLYALILNYDEVQAFFARVEEGTEIPAELFDATADLKPVKAAMERIFDRDMSIKPTASAELQQLHKKLARVERQVSSAFDRMMQVYKKQGALTDIKESYRNGRRVLAFPVESKRQINGVIHGHSDTGKTVFIEPEEVNVLNNDMLQINMDIKKEEYKVLQALCDLLRMHYHSIVEAGSALVYFDFKWAQVELALQYALQIPKINEGMGLELKQMAHPILQYRLVQAGQKVVLNDLKLQAPNRILLVSGPNAGGKSVLLKTLAFNQLLFQFGMPISADKDSSCCVFEKIMLDIGDNQSLDNDLSTYSSHLLQMKDFVEEVNKKSLLLIDEFGSGTDPKVGGAIAESMLYRFNKAGAYGLITTHYSNLKSFAHERAGLLNANMSFNTDELIPTYQLQVGQPGSSFAFEIAERIGLPKDMIRAARKKSGQDIYDFEKMLQELKLEKAQLADRAKQLEQQEMTLLQMQASYEQMQQQLELRNKKADVEQNKQLSKIIEQQELQLKEMMAQVRSEEAKILAQQEQQQLKQRKQALDAEVKQTQQHIHQREGSLLHKENLQLGQYVKVRDTDTIGQIKAINKQDVRLDVGAMELAVPIANLVAADAPAPIERPQRRTQLVERELVPSKIDIRGMSVADARMTLMHFFDQALVADLPSIEVIHGKGSGVLRRVVNQVAKEYSGVGAVRELADEHGGVGHSVIQFK